MVSFSHDPCERPLNLITQMLGSRNSSEGRGRNGTFSGSWNGHGNNGSACIGPVTSSPQRGQRRVADAEGWQTVGKRK
jgi:hypothetical protein